MLTRTIGLAAALLVAGCQHLYFSDAGTPLPLRHDLERLPFTEYWTGIVFNGDKIGFTRFSVGQSAQDPALFEIRSEAAFVLRFLGLEKRTTLKSWDLVRPDLTLERFAYEYEIDGSELKLTGTYREDALAVRIVSGGKPTEQVLEPPAKLYPASVIALYPVVHGLALGKRYTYTVYNGETQSLGEVAQEVEGYERSTFFEGAAFKVATSLHGQHATTWIDAEGRPVFELALQGVMISALEPEATAKRYLALASLNKDEALLDFSLVKIDTPIANPRNTGFLRIALSGFTREIPSGGGQQCARSGQETICELRATPPGTMPSTATKDEAAAYLKPSFTAQSNDPTIRLIAHKIAGDAGNPLTQIARVTQWMLKEIEQAPLDVFSALDVLEKRKAECQGHAYLYTAFARALGIPSRIVNGLVYSERLNGFLFHSWAESLIDGAWVAIDPVYGQIGADATHIKLVEGETFAELVPLLDWVGRIRARVIAVE